jgi:RNA polymerase sigma-70 factor (ECF subfamily)
MTPKSLVAPARLAGRPLLATQTDERLVDLVRAGNETAFEVIVNRYRRGLLRYVARLLSDGRAEDVVQQVFVNAYGALRSNDTKLRLRPWLYRIAHNLALNYYRDRSRRPQTPLENADPIAARHDTEAIAEGREELRQVMEHLEHLSDDRREALIMRFALGMDNREIARALGRSDGATKVLIHRAIKQLQEEMGDERAE